MQLEHRRSRVVEVGAGEKSDFVETEAWRSDIDWTSLVGIRIRSQRLLSPSLQNSSLGTNSPLALLVRLIGFKPTEIKTIFT